MDRTMLLIPAIALLSLCSCDSAPPAGDAQSSVPSAAAPVVAAAPSPDAELEQLKTVTPVDACAWLTPEKLKQVYPDLVFDVHQKLEPLMSGYVWDSRCIYWAGVGSIEYAKDVPTHTVEFFVATSVSEAKALANLASRRESATSSTGYQPQPALGADAYATTTTGVAMLYFVKGQSEVHVNVSELEASNEEKVRKAVAIAQSL